MVPKDNGHLPPELLVLTGRYYLVNTLSECGNHLRNLPCLLGALAVCMAAALSLHAQERGQPPAVSDAPANEADDAQPISPVFEQLDGKIERVGPDTFILLDAEGNPQKVLNMSIEQFIEAFKIQQGSNAAGEEPSSRYTLDEVRLVGSLEGNHTAISATFTITLHTTDTIEVPIGMAGALLRKLPTRQSEGPDGRMLRYDAGEGGYLVTLAGQPGEVVNVPLELMVPIRKDGTRATIELLAPRAATKGSLVMVSKHAIQSVVASEGVVLTTSTLAAGGARVEAQGIAGEFSLSWVDRPVAAQPVKSVLSASSQTLISIDGRDIRSYARIRVDAFGQSFREFTVRLPPGARHQPATGPAQPFEVEVISDTSSTGEEAGVDDGHGTELRVTLSADQTKPFTLELETIQPLHGNGGGVALQLSGVEVVGAVPQDGEVAIQIDDGWQLRWEPSDSVRLVHPSQVDFSWALPNIDEDQLVAALTFARQPWSLPVRLAPREERVVARPSYDLTIKADEAVLRMEVTYRIEGAPALPTLFIPQFTLAGWDHQNTTTRSMERVVEEEVQEDLWEFITGYATSRRPAVTMEFRRRLVEENGTTFALKLPEPKGDGLVLHSSDITVTADTSIELLPDLEASKGLVIVPIGSASDVADSRPPGQQFRYRGIHSPLGSSLEFAAKKSPRDQRVLVSSRSDITIEPDQVEVQQNLRFDVRHQPLSSVVLAAPSSIANSIANMELELLAADGEGDEGLGIPLDVPVHQSEATSAAATLPEWTVALPHPRIGKFRIRARYQLASVAPADETYRLSMITVPDAEFGGHTVELTSPEGTSLMPIEGSQWRNAPNGTDAAANSTFTFTSNRQTNFLMLTPAGRSPSFDTLEVKKIWVQTWLTPRVMQLRTAFRFRGTAREARIELPSKAPVGEQFEVVVDGTPTKTWWREQHAILVPLSTVAPGALRTLELRYQLPVSPGWTHRTAGSRPQLAGDDAGATLFWQVIAPVEYQRIASSDSLVAASHTDWSDGNWRSLSQWNTADLEHWIGARTDSVRPTRGEHSFLFRGRPRATLEAQLVRRELLVLAVSATVLAVCLALAYVPWLRQAPVLLVGIGALAATGIAAPQLAATIAPLGLFGLICGLLMWVLLVMFGPRPSTTSTTWSDGSQHAEVSGTHRSSTILPLEAGQASSNAPTVSIELADSNA